VPLLELLKAQALKLKLEPQLPFLVAHPFLELPLLEEVHQIHLVKLRSEPFGQ
jgi:hypothetical protein